MKPFHLSFAVPSLADARAFYVDILDCELGRDANDWIDVIFFGHQLTLHNANSTSRATGLDHFGPILEKDDWIALAETLKKRHVKFTMAPKISNPETLLETGKFLIEDPAGNVLEFKYYVDFEHTMRADP